MRRLPCTWGDFEEDLKNKENVHEILGSMLLVIRAKLQPWVEDGGSNTFGGRTQDIRFRRDFSVMMVYQKAEGGEDGGTKFTLVTKLP
ncbi:hypothetical protein L3X38_022013 [Prunus dulcis]|uniref:Uncharacterized protein n=1 Tax=Prunus dulcis TaxID=3755 RepID=A0AAD4VX41_PRUDU|nr:hypothetical protein L3X38_022013 [Prunus dulcis]